MSCHSAGMDIKPGEVIAVFSSSLSTAADFATLRKLLFTMAAAAAAAALVMILAIRLVFSRQIARPLKSMTNAMQTLSKGRTDVDIPGQERVDEIGEMAGAVEVFKQNAIERTRLAEERQLVCAQAAEEKRRAMNELAGEFDATVGGIVQTVISASTEIKNAAAALTHTAETAQQLSAVVAAKSDEASSNAQAVASATVELTGSISEISRQVRESATITEGAVVRVGSTNTRINELSHAAERIGDAVKLIASIASQTNSAGAERNHRSRPSRRGGQGIRRGRPRSEIACRADRQGHQ